MEMVGRIPKECLTAGEFAGVWSGWTSMGDREVVREASVKGTHLELAFKFLAYRRHWTINEAKKYFHTEVEVWINELLRKHQIHRASHILINMKKDPIIHIGQICMKCTEPELRDYLANHVKSHDGFDKCQIEALDMINCLKKYKEFNNHTLCEGLSDVQSIENVSMEEILNLPDTMKNPLLTELYFHTFESCLLIKLTNDIVWDYLLLTERVELLIKWIDKNWGGKNENIIIGEHDVTELFENLEITQEMIDNIGQIDVSTPVKELILNHLCRYGIFCQRELKDVKLILVRLLSALITPTEFDTILAKKSCNLDINNFKRNLHSLIYYQTTSTTSDSEDTYLRDKELLDLFDRMKNSATVNKRYFSQAICRTIHYITDNVDEYLKNNSLITLYLIMSKCTDEMNSINQLNFKEIINNKDGILIEDTIIAPEIIQVLLNDIPYLKEALGGSVRKKEVTMYDYLHGFKNLDVQELFRWRQRNEELPNFANENLVKKYGLKEKLTYKYYLKEARPCMAVHILQRNGGKLSNNLSSKMKSRIAFHAHIFGLKNIMDLKIISTCIAFIECLGVNSEYLRFHTTAAHYIQNELNISINDLLEAITYQNYKDLAAIVSHLERSFENEHTTTSMNDVDKFILALKSWNFIVRFATLHNTILPTNFLLYLATNNLWMEFLLVGHIFEYPMEQILEHAAQFTDKNIREHLLISLTNSNLITQSADNNLQKVKFSNSSKIAHQKSTETASSSSSPVTNYSANNLDISINQHTSPFDGDLWLTILKCHQSQDPPRALLKASVEHASPILIILAACYEPSSTASYCYSWLVISAESDELLTDFADCLNDQFWPIRRVSDLFRKIISLGFIDTLSRGFQIFMPTNPLNGFFEFLVQCLNHGEFDSSYKRLIDFTISCSTLRSNKMIDWDDTDRTYLNNEYWIATVSIECILTALGTYLSSTHVQTKFLRILVENNFNTALSIKGPDFRILWNVVTCLAPTTTRINFTAIELIDDHCNVIQEIQRCIAELTDNEEFSTALELSKIVDLTCSDIILHQYRCEFKRSMNKDGKLDKSFWKKCAQDIKKYDVYFEDAAAFFVTSAERVESHKERYEILELALEALKPIAIDQQIIDAVEMAMWKSCILAGPEAIEIQREIRTFNKLKIELLSGVSNLRVSCILNDTAEEKAVEALINRFIDVEDLETALRISAIFHYKHNDLKILMLCLSIAEGEISPNDLNNQHKLLLTESTNVKQQKYSTLLNRQLEKSSPGLLINFPSPIKNATDNIEINDSVDTAIQQNQIDCVALLEKLVKNLQHGCSVGNKILLLYRLSISLKRSYRVMLRSRDPMEILYEITGINCPRKLDLISDVISAYRIESNEVMKFLAGEVILHITRQIEDNMDSLLMWGYPLNANLHFIMELCSDPALLGWELLKSANLRLGHSHGGKRDISALKIVIELLVRAHDYFTASCCMEGIASVLRKCQNLANTLQHLKLWSLLVRLVTGVGRFTEMNYIFQIFKENDQFEFLLGKGMDKVAGLKTALLEFCKKQCPDNRDLFNLVAQHFQLYNEIALMWESEAKMVIRELIKESRKENMRLLGTMQAAIKFTKNDKTEKCLQLAIANFTHATDFFLQDNKLNLANRCARQAQLVALQVSLLNGVSLNQEVSCLLNLTTEEINRVMCQTLTFPQTLILVEAYNHNADWSSILYHHVIINGETRFLKEFLACKRLSTAIVQDCACRYRMEKNITKSMTINMQVLIGELGDIECKYVLASQLGFKNIIETMLANATTGSYLKDTVWKQGYNPQEFIGENFRG